MAWPGDDACDIVNEVALNVKIETVIRLTLCDADGYRGGDFTSCESPRQCWRRLESDAILLFDGEGNSE